MPGDHTIRLGHQRNQHVAVAIEHPHQFRLALIAMICPGEGCANQRVDGPGIRRLGGADDETVRQARSEEHTSELQSLMRISYAVFCLKTKNTINSSTYRSITAH